jgi:hypothetical protein
MAPARDELLSLHEEFNLANAAATELDVVPLDRNLVVTAIRVDLPLHRVNVGDRGEVEIFAPDERRKPLEQSFPGRDVAGAGARLDHRRAFPILSSALVVIERRSGWNRDLRGGGIRTQPQSMRKT